MESNQITQISNQTNKFIPELNNSECYKNINEIYLNLINDIEENFEKHFLNMQKNKEIIRKEAKNHLNSKYLELVSNIEYSLKEIDASSKNLEKSNNLDAKRLKQKMENTSKFIQDPNCSYLHFEESLIKLNNRLDNIMLNNLLKPDIKFSLCQKMSFLGWSGNKDPILTVTSGGISYKCWVSTANFENEFSCRVKIINIDSSRISGYWNYTFGIMKEGSSDNQSSYYNHCAILQSNGYINIPFSGSINHNTPLIERWKINDVLGIYRDSSNDIYFNINDSEKKKVFSNIIGNFNIVLGFCSDCSGEVFEMIECQEMFN